MALLTLFLENPIAALIIFIGIVLALGVHEFAHAYAANKLGDPTPKMQGRLTLNPLAHLDPVGTLLIVVAGIGWGKPVEFNPHYLRNPRRDTAIVAFAGPLSNIIIALVSTFVLYMIQSPAIAETVGTILIYFITLNLSLAIFNMIPVEPLDGFKIVGGILPPHLAYQWEDTRRYGIIVLLVLFFTGTIDRTVFPLVNYIVGLILNGLG